MKFSKNLAKFLNSLILKKIRKSEAEILQTFPGNLSKFAQISSKYTEAGINLRFRTSRLAQKLQSGEVYREKPSLESIKIWAASRGLSSYAVPIWLNLSKKQDKKHQNWTAKLVGKIKEVIFAKI